MRNEFLFNKMYVERSFTLIQSPGKKIIMQKGLFEKSYQKMRFMINQKSDILFLKLNETTFMMYLSKKKIIYSL